MQKPGLNPNLGAMFTSLYTSSLLRNCRISAPGKNQSETRAGASRLPLCLALTWIPKNGLALSDSDQQVDSLLSAKTCYDRGSGCRQGCGSQTRRVADADARVVQLLPFFSG